MNEKQQRSYDLQERLIEFAVRVLDVVESLPNSIPSFPSSLLARYSIFNLVAADGPRCSPTRRKSFAIAMTRCSCVQGLKL